MATPLRNRGFLWLARAAALVLLVTLGLRARFPQDKTTGVPTRIVSTTCSAELMPAGAAPLQLRLLSGERVLLGAMQLSRDEAIHLLTEIRATRVDRTLLFDADDALTFQDAVSVLSDASAALPDWSIFVVTPQTRTVCGQLIRSRSVGAA